MTCGIICHREWTEEDTRALLAPPYPGEFDEDWIDKALRLVLIILFISFLPALVVGAMLGLALGD